MSLKSEFWAAYLGLTAAIGSLVSPAGAEAQHLWPITVEATLGATRGLSSHSDSYRGHRSGLFLDLLIGGRLHSPSTAGAFIALDLTAHAVNFIHTADCLLAPDGACVPWYPGFAGTSFLAGWESKSTTLRIVFGPGIVTAESDRALSLVGRVDTAFPVFWRTSLTSTFATLFVPNWNSDRFVNLSVGLGLRLR